MVEGKVVRVYDVVVWWLDYMLGFLVCELGSIVIGFFLEVVKNNFLVVKLFKGLGFMIGFFWCCLFSNMVFRILDVDVMFVLSFMVFLEVNMVLGLIFVIKILEYVDEKLIEDLENIGIFVG